MQRPEPLREIATTGDGRDITRPYTGGMLLPADNVLRTRGNGDLLVYARVLSDPQVKACFEQRRNAVISREWQVDAASDRPIDIKAADHLRKQLQRVGWDRVTERSLYGVWYGFSAAELIWDVQDGLLGWKDIKVRNRRRFRFKEDGTLRLLTPAQPYDGEPAGSPYFWHFATGADHDDEPYGVGLGHWCYWPVLFKRNGIAFWMTFLEKFGMPTGLGRYPANASKEQIDKLLQAIAAIRNDSGVVIPDDMKIELLEATRGGTSDYKVFQDTMDATLAKAILGQTMTTEDGSSRAQAEVHMDVRQDIIRADADLVCESFNLGPVQWLTHFNFPGAAAPRVYRVMEEPEDANLRAERDTKVSELGFRPGLAYVHETYGAHWEPVPVENGTGLPPLPPLLDFAEPTRLGLLRQAAQQRLDTITAGATERSAQWQRFVEPRVRELQVVLDESPSLESFRDRLIELAQADADPNATFVEAIARAGFASWLVGRTAKAP